MRTTKEHGFTLIELAIVCVIVGLVFAIVLPGYGSYRKSLLKVQVREQLLQDIREARQLAITRHTPVAVAFGNGVTTTNITTYTIHCDTNGDGAVQTSELRSFRKLPNGTKLASVSLTPPDSLTFDISGLLRSGSGGQLVYQTTAGTNDTLTVSVVGMVYRQ